jgi:ADP-ribose pyrophosphatase
VEYRSEISDNPGLLPKYIVNSETVYSGRIWNVVSKTFELNHDQMTRDFIDHPGAVAILALNERDEVLVIRQYRAPVNEFLLEIPAGLTDVKDEPKLETAKRELAEETDYQASNWEILQVFHTTPGSSSERITIYLASELEKQPDSFLRTGEEKHLEVLWIPFPELLAAVTKSRLKSPTLVVAILALAARRMTNG